MSGEAIVAVSTAVVALVSLVKWAGIPDRLGPATVLIASALGVLFWAWSGNVFSRDLAWDLFVGWVAVATSAAGVFGFTRKTGDALTKFRSGPTP